MKLNLVVTILALLVFMSMESCSNPDKSTSIIIEENKSDTLIKKNLVSHKVIELEKKDTLVDSLKIGSETISSLINNFVENLKSGKSNSSLLFDNWTLLYEEYNRNDGLTTGEVDNLSSTMIDEIITINVSNDRKGWNWEGEEVNPIIYDIELSQKEFIKDWDRFKFFEYENMKNSFVVVGHGASKSIIVRYNKFVNGYLVVKLEFHDEDPG